MLAVPPSSDIRVDTISVDAFRVDCDDAVALPKALCRAWEHLSADSAEPSCFLEHWFALPSLAHLRGALPVRVLSVWAGEELVGVMPLATAHRYGRIPVRHTVNWQSGQSFYVAPLIRTGWVELFWRAVIDTLDAAPWAPSFLSIVGIAEGGAVHRGLKAVAGECGRPCPIVHRQSRALLASQLTPDAYLDAAIRSKKRKELRRLRNRLDELGLVTFRSFGPDDDLSAWLTDFLILEAAGWKGADGAAFANAPQSTAFFNAMMRGAYATGTLDFQRIDLDGCAIAMLINFHRPPGSFSFKIAYNETLARFSPGVLIELENLKRVLNNPALEWMDSCAAADHPMINSLWMERRSIVQVSVALKGARRRMIYSACRALERGSAALRRWRR